MKSEALLLMQYFSNKVNCISQKQPNVFFSPTDFIDVNIVDNIDVKLDE